MNESRREFLKGALKAAGVVGGLEAFRVLYALGGDALVKEAQASNVFISGHRTSGGGASWADWNETDEAGWGDAGTFISLFENTSAGGNETGQGGGLSGADLVLTQVGNVAGAVGSPLSRDLDGGDDYFHFTENLANVLAGQATWSVILRVADISTSNNWSEALFKVRGASDLIAINWSWGTALPLFRATKDGGGIIATQPSASDYTGTKYWAIWCDGTYVRGGYCSTKPTKWSDFAATARVSATSACQFTDGDFPTERKIGINEDATHYPNCDLYYIVISASCLIDNAS